MRINKLLFVWKFQITRPHIFILVTIVQPSIFVVYLLIEKETLRRMSSCGVMNAIFISYFATTCQFPRALFTTFVYIFKLKDNIVVRTGKPITIKIAAVKTNTRLLQYKVQNIETIEEYFCPLM